MNEPAEDVAILILDIDNYNWNKKCSMIE